MFDFIMINLHKKFCPTCGRKLIFKPKIAKYHLYCNFEYRKHYEFFIGSSVHATCGAYEKFYLKPNVVVENQLLSCTIDSFDYFSKTVKLNHTFGLANDLKKELETILLLV